MMTFIQYGHRILHLCVACALFAACTKELPPPQTDIPATQTAPPSEMTTFAPETTAPPSETLPQTSLPTPVALPALTESDTVFLYDYHPLSDAGDLYVWQADGVIEHYFATGLDWVYGEDEPLLELLNTVQVGIMPRESTKKRATLNATTLMITGNRLLGFSRDDKPDQLIPRAELAEGNCSFVGVRGQNGYAVYGGAVSQLSEEMAYSAGSMRLAWDNGEMVQTFDGAVYRRLPSDAAGTIDLSHGKALYRQKDGHTWRFWYATDSFQPNVLTMLSRYGVTTEYILLSTTEDSQQFLISYAGLASVTYSGPSMEVGALAPVTVDEANELQGMITLLNRAKLADAPLYTDYCFSDAADDPAAFNSQNALLWRDITLTTTEDETVTITHFAAESILLWDGALVFTLDEETNRRLMQLTFGMEEAEVWAYGDALGEYLAARRKGDNSVPSPGTTYVTTAPPGRLEDWMSKPLPGQIW